MWRWICFCLCCFPVTIFAQEGNALPSSKQLLPHTLDSRLLLAQASEPAPEPMKAQATVPDPKFKRRWFTRNKVHQYFGLGSLGLATLALLAPKEDDNDGIHHQLAEGAAYLGAGAVATGLVFHFDDFHFSDGFRDPDNLHALLGALGTLGYFGALEEAPDDVHATYGTAGIASMAVAIKMTW